MRITLNQLPRIRCEDYKYLYDKYGLDEPFDPISEIWNNPKRSHDNLRWLMLHCPEFRTQENLDIYLRLNGGDHDNLRWLLKNCPEYRTEKNIMIYSKWNDVDNDNLRWLLEE